MTGAGSDGAAWIVRGPAGKAKPSAGINRAPPSPQALPRTIRDAWLDGARKHVQSAISYIQIRPKFNLCLGVLRRVGRGGLGNALGNRAPSPGVLALHASMLIIIMFILIMSIQSIDFVKITQHITQTAIYTCTFKYVP